MTYNFTKILHEMNNCYMICLVVPHINDRVSINCKVFDNVIIILLDFLTVYKSMGILMHGVMSTTP